MAAWCSASLTTRQPVNFSSRGTKPGAHPCAISSSTPLRAGHKSDRHGHVALCQTGKPFPHDLRVRKKLLEFTRSKQTNLLDGTFDSFAGRSRKPAPNRKITHHPLLRRFRKPMDAGGDIVRLDEELVSRGLDIVALADARHFFGELLLPLPGSKMLDYAVREDNVEFAVAKPQGSSVTNDPAA